MRSTVALGAPAAAVGPTVQSDLRVPAGTVVRVGATSGLLAGVVLALHLALIAEIASAPTTQPGIRSGFWTPITAVAGLVLGRGSMHGSLHVGPVLLGLVLLLAVCVPLGVAGVAWVYVCVGTADWPGLAIALGLAYGLFVELIVVQFMINPLQSPNEVYGSLPSWAWWAGWGVYGMVLGLLATRRLRVVP